MSFSSSSLTSSTTPSSPVSSNRHRLSSQQQEQQIFYTKVAFNAHEIVQTHERPCLFYQDLTFDETTKLGFLIFRNYYCASVTIKYKISAAKGGDNRFHTIVNNYQLMEDPHYENDAQDWHCLDLQFLIREYQQQQQQQPQTPKEDSSSAPAATTTSTTITTTSTPSPMSGPSADVIRLYLFQPSPNWKTFALKNILCFAPTYAPYSFTSSINSDSSTTRTLDTSHDALVTADQLRYLEPVLHRKEETDLVRIYENVDRDVVTLL